MSEAVLENLKEIKDGFLKDTGNCVRPTVKIEFRFPEAYKAPDNEHLWKNKEWWLEVDSQVFETMLEDSTRLLYLKRILNMRPGNE